MEVQQCSLSKVLDSRNPVIGQKAHRLQAHNDRTTSSPSHLSFPCIYTSVETRWPSVSGTTTSRVLQRLAWTVRQSVAEAHSSRINFESGERHTEGKNVPARSLHRCMSRLFLRRTSRHHIRFLHGLDTRYTAQRYFSLYMYVPSWRFILAYSCNSSSDNTSCRHYCLQLPRTMKPTLTPFCSYIVRSTHHFAQPQVSANTWNRC